MRHILLFLLLCVTGLAQVKQSGWTTNSVPLTALGALGGQPTNAALTALASDPNKYQATNAALTALATTPSMYQATNVNLTQLGINGTNYYQLGSANLTNLAALDGSSLTNMLGATNLYQLVNLEQLQSATPAGRVGYFTSNLVSGFTLTGTVNSTNYADPLSPAAWTNAAVTTLLNSYVGAFLMTNTFTSIASGLGEVEIYCYEAGSGSASVTAEMYVVNAVSKIEEFEFNPPPVAQAVFAGSTPTRLQFSIPITDYTSTTNLHIMVKIKATVVSGSPVVRLVGGGAFPSHVSFQIPGALYLTKTEAAAGYQPLSAQLTQFATDTTNYYQKASANLTNWSLATTNLYALAATTQPGSANLTNWSLAATNLYFLSANQERYGYIWVDAGAMKPTNSTIPEAKTLSFTNTDQQIDAFAFDSASAEPAYFKLTMPDNWDRYPIKAKFYWSCLGSGTNASTTNGMRWTLSASAVHSGGVITNLIGTAQGAEITNAGPERLNITPATAAITVSGTPALGDQVFFQVLRTTTATLTTYTNIPSDGFLHGVQIQYGLTNTPSAIW
jgi:hypothetical protein